MIFALAGNQNCGKTTLFNQLTGSNQHVGNFPGVTVDQKSGPVRGQKDCTVVDLPKIGITGNQHNLIYLLFICQGCNVHTNLHINALFRHIIPSTSEGFTMWW